MRCHLVAVELVSTWVRRKGHAQGKDKLCRYQIHNPFRAIAQYDWGMSLFSRSKPTSPPEPEPPLPPEQKAQRDHALDLLQAGTGDPASDFRDDQWNVIDALVNRREKVLLVQRTGWGKSAVYFITAKLLREAGQGPTLIVSPLLALMRNQVMAGKRMGLRIGALHSGTADRFDTFVDLVRNDAIDILLVSPERFANAQFLDGLLPLVMERTGLLVVDEAHCISDWGHDFRPDYQRLANLIRQLPSNIPLLATTATANDRVVEDVRRQLGNVRVSRGALIRDNLALQTMDTMSATERLAWLAQTIPNLPGRGIVYTLTKHDAERVADWLVGQGIEAHAYHADIVTRDLPDTTEAKKWLEDAFATGDLKVLVATTALGMGYDNPDVRFVIHYGTPGSIIAYYQQVGRAGRGRDGAVGVLMNGPEDADIHASFRTGSLPTGTDVIDILNALGEADGLTATQLMARVNMPKGRLDAALRYLSVQQPAPVARDGRLWRRTPAPWRSDYVDHRDGLIALREREWEEMQRYRRQATGCQMRFLLAALDDPAPPPRCGICENCRGEPVLPVALDPGLMHAAHRALGRVAANVIVPRLQIPKDALPIYGFPTRIPPDRRAEPGRALGRWGDEAWGDRVAQGRIIGEFSEDLVDAAAAMIGNDWNPSPRPAWVTAVPSRRQPLLVPEFARALADRLGLPYVDALARVRDTEEQKAQANSAWQCRNLDGAFATVGALPSGPVLLVDDVVDSGWTLAILAMLLRAAGGGPVLPFALATARPRDS
jgi:ATP-dependent DNA helicase RecQ